MKWCEVDLCNCNGDIVEKFRSSHIKLVEKRLIFAPGVQEGIGFKF